MIVILIKYARCLDDPLYVVTQSDLQNKNVMKTLFVEQSYIAVIAALIRYVIITAYVICLRKFLLESELILRSNYCK